ncbi:MAG: S1 RNA-binding domain-containing protein, partial [Bdellovibrionota bacterium]
MSKKDLFGDDLDTTPSQDFASMFEQSAKAGTRKVNVGDQVKGELLSIGREQAFVSIGTSQDGILLLKDLLDENGAVKYKVGEFLDVVVIKISKDETRLARKGATKSSGEAESLEDAFDMEMPVEGKVLEAVNGGFRVQIMGTKAFCPISQMDRRQLEVQNYIGKTFDFIITQFESNGRNIVVSRRKLLEMEQAGQDGNWIETHKIGDIVTGQVTRLEAFGAFVDVGNGVEGLVHISELSWSRVKNTAEVVHVGDHVQVKVLKIDDVDGRL